MAKSCGCYSMKNSKKAAIYVLLFMLVFVGTISVVMMVGVKEGMDTASDTDTSMCGNKGKMTVNPLPYASGGQNAQRDKLNANIQEKYANSRCAAANDNKVQTPK